MSSENTPHIVYSKDDMFLEEAHIFPSYREAYEFWHGMHTLVAPYLIATLGRVIDPSAAIVDVSE